MSPRRNVQRRKAPSQRFSPYDPTAWPLANEDGEWHYYKRLKNMLRGNGFIWSMPVLRTNRRDKAVNRLLRAQGFDTKQRVEDAMMELVDASRVLKGWDEISSLVEVGHSIKAKLPWTQSFSIVALWEFLNAIVEAYNIFAKTNKNAHHPSQHSALSNLVTAVEQDIGGFETFRTEHRIWASMLPSYVFVDDNEFFAYNGDQVTEKETEPSFLHGIDMNTPDKGINKCRNRPIERPEPSSSSGVQAAVNLPPAGAVNMPFRPNQGAISNTGLAGTHDDDDDITMEDTTN